MGSRSCYYNQRNISSKRSAAVIRMLSWTLEFKASCFGTLLTRQSPLWQQCFDCGENWDILLSFEVKKCCYLNFSKSIQYENQSNMTSLLQNLLLILTGIQFSWTKVQSFDIIITNENPLSLFKFKRYFHY